MNINIEKKDIIWSYLGTLLSMMINFLMLPLIIYFLDNNMLGLWYVFLSIGALVTLFDCGFTVTFARNITYCWSGAEKLEKENISTASGNMPNFVLMKKVLKACKFIYLIISSIALFVLLTFGSWYIYHLTKSIVVYDYFIAWGIYIISIFFNLYYGYYISFLRGVGAIDEVNKCTVIARVLQIIITVISLYLGYGIIGLSLGYLAYGFIFRGLAKYKFYNYKNIGNELNTVVDKVAFIEIKNLFFIIWHNAWKDGCISITNYISDQVSILICSLYLTLSDTGIYSLGTQIATAVAVIASTLYTTYQPQIQNAYFNRNLQRLQNTMSIIVVTFILLFIIVMLLTFSIGIPILKLIKPEAIISGKLLLGLCLYQFILKFRNCYTSYFSCTNRIPYLKAFVLTSALSIALSITLLEYFNTGLWGLIIAQIVSQLIYNSWYWMYKAHNELKLTFIELVLLGIKNLKKVRSNNYA